MKDFIKTFLIIFIIECALSLIVIGIADSIERGKRQRTEAQEKKVELILEQERELSEWEMLQMAIVLTESNFDSLAVGAGECRGIFQLREIYVKEVNNILERQGSDKRYTFDDAFSIQKSVEMFNILQEDRNETYHVTTAIRNHNRGGAYIERVLKNMDQIEKMEAVRRAIKGHSENPSNHKVRH